MDHRHDNLNSLKLLFSRNFTLLNSARSKWQLIILTSLIGTLFILVYNPMDVNNYFINSRIGSLLSIRSAGIIGGLVLIITQFGLRRLTGLTNFTIGNFLAWVILELFVIAIVFFAIYGERGQPFFDEFLLVLEHTYLLSILPYSLALLITALLNIQKISAMEKEVDQGDLLISISDDNNRPVFSVRASDLIMLKSEDNYVNVYYLEDNEVKNVLVRRSMKSLEKQFFNSELLRVHRSFSVNMRHVNSIRKSKRKQLIRVNHIVDPIPVSEKYKGALSQYMDTHS